MATIYGIDISENNGQLNWIQIGRTGEVDFAIIRAGYGRNNIDLEYARNVAGCLLENIPIGIYWFSYALSEQDAANEGNYCCDAIESITGTTVPLGVWYDWEYASEDYAINHGVTPTPILRERFALAFCNACISRGYDSGIYTNKDFLSRGMRPVVDAGYPLWLADWDISQPSEQCNIWQYGLTSITGIPGDFDGDAIGDDFPPFPPKPQPVIATRRFPFYLYDGYLIRKRRF